MLVGVRARRILDIGCGEGALGAALPPLLRSRLVGLDASGIMLRASPPPVVQADATALPFLADVFDAAVAVNVLDHLAVPTVAIGEAHRILGGGGILIVATASRRDSPELVEVWRPPPSSFDAEDGPRLVASVFGIADLETFRRQAPKFQAHELERLVGPYPEAVATYRARSPLQAVDRIARPVLLVHGLEDTVVPPSQAQIMADALARRGVRHVLLTFPGEGHGFRRPESIRRALEVELSFHVAALGLSPGTADAPLATDDTIAASSSDQPQGR